MLKPWFKGASFQSKPLFIEVFTDYSSGMLDSGSRTGSFLDVLRGGSGQQYKEQGRESKSSVLCWGGGKFTWSIHTVLHCNVRQFLRNQQPQSLRVTQEETPLSYSWFPQEWQHFASAVGQHHSQPEGKSEKWYHQFLQRNKLGWEALLMTSCGHICENCSRQGMAGCLSILFAEFSQ